MSLLSGAMRHTRIKSRFISLLVAAAVIVGACSAPGGDDDVAATTIPVVATTALAPVDDFAVPSESGTVGEWHCGQLKVSLYNYVTIMSSFAEFLDSPPLYPGPNDVWSTEDLREAMRVSAQGFTTADQDALNAACELFGQHDAALELWNAGDRGDACDVWLPAHASAERMRFDITEMHPMVANTWVSATGSVSEGNGRCIAEKAN